MEDIVKALLETNKELTAQIIELSKALVEARQPIYGQTYPLMEASKFPLSVPETEEDARYQYETGLIGKGELEEALKEIGFYSHEIEVPSGL